MAQDTYEKTSQLLKEYHFEIEIICSICKNIMRNAYKGPCGCRYCLECIKKHIEGYDKYCPGQSDICKNAELNYDCNLKTDELANETTRKIVKCPNKMCIFEDLLIEMINHFRLCDLYMTNCPYLNMGCKQFRITNENMKQHLLMEIVSHTKMQMEFNNNVNNEMEVLKRNYEKLNNENEFLKSQLISQEKLIENLNGNNLLINGLFENIDSLKNQLENLKIANERKAKKQQEEFLELKQELNQTEKYQTEMQSRLNEIDNSKLEQIDDKLISMKIDLFELASNTSSINITGELVWKIDNFSQQRKNKWNCSKSFYSHKDGYKICMGVLLNEHLLNVGLCLIRGEHDNLLPWPFNRVVIIELINQLKHVGYKKKVLQYSPDLLISEWNKPINEMNEFIGSYGFFKMDELKNNAEVYRNDQIIIKCSINT